MSLTISTVTPMKWRRRRRSILEGFERAASAASKHSRTLSRGSRHSYRRGAIIPSPYLRLPPLALVLLVPTVYLKRLLDDAWIFPEGIDIVSDHLVDLFIAHMHRSGGSKGLGLDGMGRAVYATEDSFRGLMHR